MGLVFKITLNSKEYALKILHPGIKQKLHSEIEHLLLLGGYFAKLKGFPFDKKIFETFLLEMFDEETDLEREARMQQLFFANFSEDRRFLIPWVEVAYSNQLLLCQNWINSTLAQDLKEISQFNVFHFFFKALLQNGLLH